MLHDKAFPIGGFLLDPNKLAQRRLFAAQHPLNQRKAYATASQRIKMCFGTLWRIPYRTKHLCTAVAGVPFVEFGGCSSIKSPKKRGGSFVGDVATFVRGKIRGDFRLA